MAPKGNRQKNSLDRCEATKRHTGSDSESVDVPLSEKGERLSFDQNMVDAEVPSGDKKGSSSNGLGKKDHNKNLVTGRKSKQRSGKVATGEKVMDRSLNSAESIEKSTRDAARSNILSDASDCREDDTSLCSEHKARICKRSIHGCLSVENVMGYCTTSVTVIERSLRSLAAFISQAVNGWIEQQKPSVMNLTAGVLNARDYVHARVKHLSPIMWAWMLQFGKLMILLSMIWLDCNIRGFDSLLRLGTSTFFVIIWCTILSIAAMVGISKLLIIMVIAALLGLFVGFAMSMLLAGICSIVILWLYGSFWTTGLVILLGGIMFALSRDRIALMISMLYAMYCARSYVGWLGLLFGLNLSFISGDVLLYLLKNNLNEHGSNTPSDHAGQNQGRGGHFYGEHSHSSTDDAFHSASVRYSERSPGDPSTSGAEEELTSENEVARLLNCNNHYSALGLARYENVDVSILKREYRKKAMLVHPDKNMGNEKAEEAFKKLQNAYEVLIDSLKRKTYDDELRREELLNYFRRFNDTLQKKGRHGFFSSGSTYYEAEGEGSHGELRRIACKKCNNFHIWTRVERSKSQARWCQDCKDFHQAKDGDGWLEQSSHSVLFGLLLKREVPCAYVCAESRIYDATEWFICQGMRCPANTHRPSFHVNMSAMSKQNGSKGPSSSHGHRGAGGTSMDDAAVTEEEFFEWFQNVVQSGFFEGDDNNAQSNESPSPKAAAANSSSSKGCNNNSSTNSIKKKKRGKKQR